MRRAPALAAALSLAAVLVASSCGRREQPSSDAPPSTPTTETPTTETALSTDGVETVVLTPTTETRTITVDGRTRTYRLHVPDGLPAREPVPLVVALHGGLGRGEQFARTTRLDEQADEHGFVIVYPDGTGAGKNDTARTWNGGYCCGPAQAADVDDVGFVVTLVEDVEAQYPIDASRVFALGHSNGAIMSYRLACEASDTFVAIGVVAGSLGVECDPTAPVSVIHVHGDADQNHPVEGGHGTRSVLPDDFEFQPAQDALDTWVALDGCNATGDVSVDGAVTTTRWTGCDVDTEVDFLLVAGADHPWPGSAPSALSGGPAGMPSQALDASEVVIDFLLAHPRAT